MAAPGSGHVRIITAWLSPKTGRTISPAYQRTLIRKGIRKQSFESGAAYRSGAVKAARRHTATPEHGLREALRNPEKNKEYLRKRQSPGKGGFDRSGQITETVRNIDRLLGDYFKYDPESVRVHVELMSHAQREFARKATVDDLLRFSKIQNRSQIKGLFVKRADGTWINPFWYHRD
jgi:hypothetical protein